MKYVRLVPTILVTLLMVIAGCASATPPPGLRADEMNEGFRAARRGYWQEALMRFERAEKLEPLNAGVLNNLAVALEAVGRYEEAGEVYKRALLIDPRDNKLKKNMNLYNDFYKVYIKKEEPGGPAAEDLKNE